MSSTLAQLAERRALLVARCDAQRMELAYHYRRLCGPFRLAETAFGLLSTLRRSPLLVSGLTAVLVNTPWRKASRLPSLFWRGWRIFQFVRRWLR